MLKKLIKDLLKTGLSQTELANAIGDTSQSTISRMKDGLVDDDSCPKSRFERIEKLHRQRCRKSVAIAS